MSLQKRVLEYIRRQRLWEPKMSICLGVSGGVDSMVLLDIVHKTTRAHKGLIQVCTIDHQLRPTSSEECTFVYEESQKRGIPCVIKKMDIPKGGNLYERARMLRRALLLEEQCARIATGHHQNDQAETLLYRLLRGGGVEGLAGMTPQRGVWCRPLLFSSKEEIVSYAHTQKLVWYDDPSNKKSMRGKLRALMTDLDGVHGPAAPSLARSARLLEEDRCLLQHIQQQAWDGIATTNGLKAELFWKEHKGLQLRLLRMLCQRSNVPVRAETLIRFVQERAPVLLPHKNRLLQRRSWIVIEQDH